MATFPNHFALLKTPEKNTCMLLHATVKNRITVSQFITHTHTHTHIVQLEWSSEPTVFIFTSINSCHSSLHS